MEKDVLSLWQQGLPISEISKQTNLKNKEIKNILGDNWSPRQNHYHYVDFRDKQNYQKLLVWFKNEFSHEEFLAQIKAGNKKAYFDKIAKENKVSETAVRNLIKEKIGELPIKSRTKQVGDYKIGKKSKYYQKEAVLILMWQKDHLSIEKISTKTGVSRRVLSKLLIPMGYQTPKTNLKTRFSAPIKKTSVKEEIVSELLKHQEVLTNPQARVRWLKEECKKRNANYQYVTNYFLKKYPQFSKDNLALARIEKYRNSILDDYHNLLTVNAIAKKYHISNRSVVKLLKQENVYQTNEEARQAKFRKENGQKISASLAGNSFSKNRAYQSAVIPHDYLGLIPDWAWKIISSQKEVLLLDKLKATFNDKDSVLQLFKKAEINLGHKITNNEITAYVPPIKNILSWSQQIYDSFPNDKDINLARNSFSNYEQQVLRWAKTNNLDFSLHDRKTLLSKQELDFYFPTLKLAIEVNPLATHNSNKYQPFGITGQQTKSESYHQRKFLQAQKQGITLISLFEEDLTEPKWTNKTIPFLNMKFDLQKMETYYARQIVIREISTSVAKDFLNLYHLDGSTPAKWKFGIFSKQNNELLGVFTLGVPHAYKSKNLVELKRLGWKSGIQVRFGISKITKFVERNFDFEGLLTYSNNNIGYGKGYQKSAFKLLSEGKPQLTFVNPYNPFDKYSWSVATPWSAKSGVIAKKIQPMNLNRNEARKIVEMKLPHRTDNKEGYVAQFDAGNRVWLKKW